MQSVNSPSELLQGITHNLEAHEIEKLDEIVIKYTLEFHKLSAITNSAIYYKQISRRHYVVFIVDIECFFATVGTIKTKKGKDYPDLRFLKTSAYRYNVDAAEEPLIMALEQVEEGDTND